MTERVADLFHAGLAGAVLLATQSYAVAVQMPMVISLQDLPNLSGPEQISLLAKILEQGGLFVVIVLVLYFYRRDFRHDKANQQATISALLHVVQANVTAMQESKATSERLARAVEANNERRRSYDQKPAAV